MRSVVVVGAGQGGVSAVESLRERGFDGDITLVDASHELPYRRPPLSKAYLSGEVDRASLSFRPPRFYEEVAIRLELGSAAAHVDHSRRRVTLASGLALRYDHLVLALGSTPRRWTGEGCDLAGIHYLGAAEDADRLREGMKQAATLTVIGGGFIGLEVASTAAKAGLRVTVLESSDRVMARALSPIASEHLTQRHRNLGVDVRTKVTVDAIVGSAGAVSGVRLGSGEIVPSELVLVGIGSQAVTSPLDSTFIDASLRAIRVNELLLSDDMNISAIGDAAAFPRNDARIRLESVQNAADQGRAVAARLTGVPSRYSAVPWFWTEQAGVKVQMAGLASGATEFVVRGNADAGRFSVFSFHDGQLLGAESFGRSADHIAVRNLLAAHAPLRPDQASDNEFDLAAYAKAASIASA